MAELRSVDPRTLKPNPNNPRKTPAPQAMDDQLLASITAIGIIQPPVVREVDGELIIKAGERRVKAAIRAEMPVIDVLVRDTDDANVPMESLSENLVRAAMNNVDIWRAIERLEKEGWNEQAIADALALPVRTVKRLKLLARLHPPMLDVMAKGSMPSEDQLRTIAAASIEEQAQVWKKNKPKKGDDLSWYHVAHALSKRRIPFAAAKFDDELARAYGIEWHDDLFAPAGEDGRYTTNVDGFFGAQQEWLANHLPEKGTLLTQNEYGQPELPKKAERIYGKPGKGDITGHYLDPNSGEVKTVAYRMPVAVKPTKPGKGADAAATPDDDEAATPAARSRPEVTSRGSAMIGDLRTGALHRALQGNAFSDQTLIGLLVLALAGKNVSVQGPNETGAWDRQALGAKIAQGGVLTRRRRPAAADGPRDAGLRAVLPGQHEQQRCRRLRGGCGYRCRRLPAEHGHRGVPRLPVPGGARALGRDGRCPGGSAREGHTRPHGRTLQGRNLDLPQQPVHRLGGGHRGPRRRQD